jgi:hypothetical protein
VKEETTTNKKRPRRRVRTAGGVIERLEALAVKDNPAVRRRVDKMLAKILDLEKIFVERKELRRKHLSPTSTPLSCHDSK